MSQKEFKVRDANCIVMQAVLELQSVPECKLYWDAICVGVQTAWWYMKLHHHT